MSSIARRLLPWAGAAAAVVIAAAILLFFPSKFLLNAAAERWLPTGSRWTSIGRDHVRFIIRDLTVPGRPAGFRAHAVTLTHSIPAGIFSGVWRFEADRAVLAPADPRWAELVFHSGRGRWISAERRLELREWSSEHAFANADIEWDVDGHIRRARIWGNADPSDLQKTLSAWKILKVDEAAPSARLPFELTYQKGELLIRVNGKPFFKASWRSDGAF